jgi:N-acetylglutamate synthase-like GNAT family acetyltransferase
MKNPDDIHIERAELKDLPEILSLQKIAYLSEAAIYNDYSIPPLTQDIDSIIEEFHQGIFLKAMLHNKIAGSIRAHVLGDTCFINKLIVDNAHQNKSIGTMLMKRIEEEFKNVSRYELFTGHKSEKNLYLYRKLGYTDFSNKPVNKALILVFLEKRNSK